MLPCILLFSGYTLTAFDYFIIFLFFYLHYVVVVLILSWINMVFGNSFKNFFYPVVLLGIPLFIRLIKRGYNLDNTDEKLVSDSKNENSIIWESRSEYNYKSDFIKGLALVELDQKYGFVDSSENEIVPLIYDAVELFSEGLACVQLNGKWGYINEKGRIMIDLQFDHASSFTNNKANVRIEQRSFIIDKAGEIV